MAKKNTTTATAPAVVTYSAADVERIVAERIAASREADKAAKAAKRNARSVAGFHPLPVDPSRDGDRNVVARCVYVVPDVGPVDVSLVLTREGYRVAAAVGGIFGVPGDTAPGADPAKAIDRLSAAIVAKAAAFGECRDYLTGEAAKAAKAGRVYREKAAKA